MRIQQVRPKGEGELLIVADDGRVGMLDVRPYWDAPAFRPLRDPAEFATVRSGGYFVAWDCGADLSADTIEARWVLTDAIPAPHR